MQIFLYLLTMLCLVRLGDGREMASLIPIICWGQCDGIFRIMRVRMHVKDMIHFVPFSFEHYRRHQIVP